MPPRRLVEYPVVTVNDACGLCPRRGRYRLARLAERFGARAMLDDVLQAIVGGCGPRCGARFEDLAPQPSPSAPPPAVTGVALRRHGPPREALPRRETR